MESGGRNQGWRWGLNGRWPAPGCRWTFQWMFQWMFEWAFLWMITL